MKYLQSVSEDIIQDIKEYDPTNTNIKLLNCIRGDLLSVLEEEFRYLKDDKGLQDRVQMATPLNYILKLINKLSQLYTFEVKRTDQQNQQLIDFYKKYLEVDTVMQTGNDLYNGMKAALFEVYPKEDWTLGFRAIPLDRFYVWSDSAIEPNTPKVYVKHVGKKKSLTSTKKVSVYHFYTDTEFYAVDEEGNERKEYLVGNEGKNIYGVAPFVYVTKEKFDLIPSPNRDLLKLTLIPPTIFTDAVVSNFYQANPIRILKNVDLDKSEINVNPHAVTVLEPKMGSTQEPSLTELSSSLDTSKSTDLAEKIIEQLLFVYDLQATGTSEAPQSAAALTIKESSTVENRKRQIEHFRPAEERLWNVVLPAMHRFVTLQKAQFLPSSYPRQQFINPNVEIDFSLPDTNIEQKQELNDTDTDGE